MSMSAKRDIETIISLLRTDDSADAPEAAVRWVKNLFATRMVESKSSSMRRMLATLVSDLLPNSAIFGQRSAGTSQSRRLLFEAEDNAIDLRIEGGKAGAQISGQIIGEGFEGAKVMLIADDARFATEADDMCLFNLGGIPNGTYTLIIGTDDVEIHAEDIVLGH
jgi:hypothetical protein